MSDVVLLRTLTRKSIIGFGNYKDITVQNILDLRQHKVLLEIYYFFRNIDFMPDILQELFIIGERVVDKKIPKERYNKKNYVWIGLCLRDILNKENEQFGRNKLIGMARKKKRINKHIQKSKEVGLNRTIFSKGGQRNKNQW
jgi:hypothetical protein